MFDNDWYRCNALSIESERGPIALLLNMEGSQYRAGYDLGETVKVKVSQ